MDQRQHREHAELLADEGQARVGGGDPLADRIDPVAHSGKLDQPAGAKLGIVEDDARARGAMIGRHRPHFARALEHVRHRRRGRFGDAGLDEQRSDAVAIAAEILVAALRDDHFVARARMQAQAERILVEPAAEALVGDVDERHQPALGDHVA